MEAGFRTLSTAAQQEEATGLAREGGANVLRRGEEKSAHQTRLFRQQVNEQQHPPEPFRQLKTPDDGTCFYHAVMLCR